jgi:hypothetical protein
MARASPPLSPRIFFEGGSRLGFNREGLRGVRLRDLAIRFVFGFAVSVFAGLMTVVFGNRIGGLFLAFPAILPASLTLIEQTEGRRQAEGNAVGAIIGAIALAAFAVTAHALFTQIPAAAVEMIALGAWIGVAVLLYTGARALFRKA